MRTNALKLRQSLGAILSKLQKTKEPIIIERNREPVAVLVSYETFKERFIDYQERRKIAEIVEEFRRNQVTVDQPSLDVLRELRYGSKR
ncbi:MAG: hypothetical protein DCC75_06605 [Proteobacteria bacterium]|nr:MAG: hypothetical protein DCC75_06605 [Pseudomonadota bacterium]